MGERKIEGAGRRGYLTEQDLPASGHRGPETQLEGTTLMARPMKKTIQRGAALVTFVEGPPGNKGRDGVCFLGEGETSPSERRGRVTEYHLTLNICILLNVLHMLYHLILIANEIGPFCRQGH